MSRSHRRVEQVRVPARGFGVGETEQLYHRFLGGKASAALQLRWLLDDLLHSTGRHHGLRQDMENGVALCGNR